MDVFSFGPTPDKITEAVVISWIADLGIMVAFVMGSTPSLSIIASHFVYKTISAIT